MTQSSPLHWIRKSVLGLTQNGLATICGVSRPRISRYERGHDEPPFSVLARIRAEAIRLGHPFSGDWFFEVPADPAGATVPDDVQ